MATLRPEDLPAWMRPRSRVIDRGWLIVLGFCALLLLPLLTRTGLPVNSNADLYAYRSLEVKRLLQSGSLYSRWSPDFNYTFGSPVFNYLAPLPHYLAGIHQDITEADPISSIRLLVALAILAAGSGMYLFVRGRWGSHAALISSLVYAYSPALAQTLPYRAGDLGPLLAMALLPWTLWALDRFWQDLTPTNLVTGALLLSAFLLSDNRIILLGLPVIVMALIALPRRTWPQRRAYRYLLLATAAAFILCAFFWLPALAERDAVHWLPLSPDSYAGPIPLDEILGLTSRSIGIGTWLLAASGIVGIILQIRSGKRPGVLSFAVLGLIFLVTATPAFAALWISGFQAPLAYHALLLAIFCLAIVGGQSAYLITLLPLRWQAVSLVLVALLGPVAILPTLYMPQWQAFTGSIDTLEIAQTELQGKHTGTFRDGVLLPVSAGQIPEPPHNLLDQLKLNTFQRVNADQYATHVSSLDQGLLQSHYIIDTTQPVVIEFGSLYYPGWTASINGQDQPIQPSSDGLITLSVPQSSSDVTFSFEGTPIRTAAWVISLIGVILLIVVSRRLRRHGTRNTLLVASVDLARREQIGLTLALFLYAAALLTIYARLDLLLATR